MQSSFATQKEKKKENFQVSYINLLCGESNESSFQIQKGDFFRLGRLVNTPGMTTQ